MYFLTDTSLTLFILAIGWLLLTAIIGTVSILKREKIKKVSELTMPMAFISIIPLFIIMNGLENANNTTIITKDKIEHHYTGKMFDSPLFINEKFMKIQNDELHTKYTFNDNDDEVSIESEITAQIDTKKISNKVLYKYFNPSIPVSGEKFLLYSIIENEFRQLTNKTNISSDIKEIDSLLNELSKNLEEKYGIKNSIEITSISVLTYKK